MDLQYFITILMSILVGAGATYIFMLGKLSSESKKWEEQSKNYFVIQSNLESRDKEISKLEALKNSLETDLRSTRERLTVQETINKTNENKMQDQKRELLEINEKLNEGFKNLANEILEEKSKRFTEINQQNMTSILNPLTEKIKEFGNKFQENFEKDLVESASVRQQIQNLSELNKKMTEEANNLSTALRGSSKVQGDWGEVQLATIFELSGLTKNTNYTLQENIKTDDNSNTRPDAIVKFPDGKSIVVDSKVSLKSYVDYCNTEDSPRKKEFLKAHILSIKNHITGLSSKAYQNNLEKSVDFVFLFMPIEGAFSLAMQNDPTLFQEAAKNNIFIVTPTTLLSSLRTVHYTWKQESQKQNIREIVELGSEILNKLVAFSDDFGDIEKNLNSALKAHENAVKKIKGRDGITSKVNKLKSLGVTPSKIPKVGNLLLTDSDSDLEEDS
jgi:DNA recombination protein RmuC